MIHRHPHPLAGETVTANWRGETEEYDVEDYWDRVSALSWSDFMLAGNPAVILYSARVTQAMGRIPPDDEVLYGKDRYGLGHLVHVSELG